ncbi:MAG: hypothetical protein IJZ54_00310 [Clostridia bacterium]|nr:hypothetical protein [Clostridia bacterium]
MYDLTCSFHKGTCASSHIGHNNRSIFVPHADPKRKHLNVCYIDMTVEEAYHYLFDDALAEYNKGKKPCRQIKDYYQHIMGQYLKGEAKLQEAISSGASKAEQRRIKSKYPKPYYEVIITVGNCDTYDGIFKCGQDKEQLVVDVLDEYMSDFQKRNSHLFVFSAHLHRDEVGNGTTSKGGVPHIHLCYIPWTDLEGRGLPVRVSENGAFKQQGLTSGKLGDMGTIHFQEQEREAIKEIANEYGINIVDGKHSKKHLSKEEYILRQEQEKSKASAELVEQEAGELLQQQDNFIEFVQNSNSAVAYLEHRENAELRKTVSEYEKIKQRSEIVLSEVWQEFNSATSEYFEQYRRKKKLLFDEIQRARKDANHSRKRLKRILNNITYSNDFFIIKMFKLVFALFIAIETKSLEQDVQELQKKNQEIKIQAKQIITDGQTIGDKLRNKDLDMIEQSLIEYEKQLEKSIQQINEITIYKTHSNDTPER